MKKGIRWRRRTALPADRDAILRLAKSQMDPVLMAAWGIPVDPKDLFEAEDLRLYVVERQAGGMIGFYGLLSMEEILHVQTLVISQAAQGAGLGTEIMKSIEREARESRFTAVELCVQTTNPRAIRFYERLGFESYGMVFFSTLLMHKDVKDSP